MFQAIKMTAATVALLGGIAGVDTYAQASPDDPDVTTQLRQVSTAGLDLNSAAGQAMLRHRIYGAAIKVCSDEGSRQGIPDDDFEDCLNKALVAGFADAKAVIAYAARPTAIASAKSK